MHTCRMLLRTHHFLEQSCFTLRVLPPAPRCANFLEALQVCNSTLLRTPCDLVRVYMDRHDLSHVVLREPVLDYSYLFVCLFCATYRNVQDNGACTRWHTVVAYVKIVCRTNTDVNVCGSVHIPCGQYSPYVGPYSGREACGGALCSVLRELRFQMCQDVGFEGRFCYRKGSLGPGTREEIGTRWLKCK